MLNAALEAAPRSLEPGVPGNIHFTSTAWRITRIDGRAKTVDLTADPDRPGAKEPPLHGIPFAQLRLFDAPPAYPPPPPNVGMYVNVVQRPTRVTSVSLTMQSLAMDEEGNEEKVSQAIARAKDFFGVLLRALPAEAWAMGEQPGKASGFNAAIVFPRLHPRVLRAVFDTLPLPLMRKMAAAATTTDGYNPAHALAARKNNARSDREIEADVDIELAERVLALR